MRAHRFGHSATAVAGELVVCGGRSQQLQALRTVERFDPVAMAWQTRAPMSTARFGHAAAVLAGRLHVCGGTNEAASEGLASVESMCPRTGLWRTAAKMRAPRSGHAAAALGGVLYACGGDSLLAALRSGESLRQREGARSSCSGRWRRLPDMPEARTDHAAAACAGRLFVFGGLGQDGAAVASAACFVPATGTWEALPAMSAPRCGPVAAALAGRVYVCGGTCPAARGEAADVDEAAAPWQALSSVECWLPAGIAGPSGAEGRWEAGPGMTSARYGAAAAPLREL